MSAATELVVSQQEGQRAVDVARSEHHAGCADFLKYYTMLVTIGDEEEPPMYTGESNLH